LIALLIASIPGIRFILRRPISSISCGTAPKEQRFNSLVCTICKVSNAQTLIAPYMWEHSVLGILTRYQGF
jgi:hypothetical protein